MIIRNDNVIFSPCYKGMLFIMFSGLPECFHELLVFVAISFWVGNMWPFNPVWHCDCCLSAVKVNVVIRKIARVSIYHGNLTGPLHTVFLTYDITPNSPHQHARFQEMKTPVIQLLKRPSQHNTNSPSSDS